MYTHTVSTLRFKDGMYTHKPTSLPRIHDAQNQARHFASDRDDHVSRASKALDELITPARNARAMVSLFQTRLEEVQANLGLMKKENERKRDRLRMLRESLATRRRNLSAAKLVPFQAGSPGSPRPTQGFMSIPSNAPSAFGATTTSPSPAAAAATAREIDALNNLSTMIARARSGLVQELVEVFNIVEIGGRPPIGGKAGTKGEWTIGDLILPVPGDMRRYPPDHINAVITHTVHFLNLLTFYLGVKLPFEIKWTGGKLGVGQPWIGAIQGGESGGWARWHQPHPLHLSSSNTHTPSSSSKQSPTPSDHPITNLSESTILAASAVAANPPSSALESSFTTSLAMLLYNVSYLAHTQGVDVALNQVGYVLSNLWMVCCSPELGRRSHETFPFLPLPTPVTFPLDFNQLLQAITAAPAARPRKQRSVNTTTTPAKQDSVWNLVRSKGDEAGKEEDEEWDLVDDDV